MGYFGQALTGAGWVAFLRGSTRVISFAKNIILARFLLGPAEFGTIGIALLSLAFLETMLETGVNIVLIQSDDNVDEYINTAFVVSILRGILISLILFLAAPYVAKFFKNSNALFMLYLISIVPIMRGFINPSVVKFHKEIQFKKEFVYKLISFFLDAVFAIFFTWYLKNPIGVILGILVGVLSEIILSYVLVRPWPSFKFEKEKFNFVINRGKWLTGAGIFSYLFREGDDIIVGRILGSSALGYYEIAYKVATLPITEISDVITKVSLPVFVKIRDNKKRLIVAYLKTTFFVSFLSLIFGALLFIFAKEVIYFVFGEEWLPAYPALQAVSIYAVIRSMISPSYTLLLSLGKQKEVSFITFIGIFVMALVILPFVSLYGIVGAGLSTIVASLATVPFIIFYSIKAAK